MEAAAQAEAAAQLEAGDKYININIINFTKYELRIIPFKKNIIATKER